VRVARRDSTSRAAESHEEEWHAEESLDRDRGHDEGDDYDTEHDPDYNSEYDVDYDTDYDSQEYDDYDPEDEEGGEERRHYPWHFKMIAVGTVIYLGYRTYQGITWVIHHV